MYDYFQNVRRLCFLDVPSRRVRVIPLIRLLRNFLVSTRKLFFFSPPLGTLLPRENRSRVDASDPLLAIRERRSEQRDPSLLLPTRVPSRVKIIDGAIRIHHRSPCLFLSPADSVFPFEVREGRRHGENRRGNRTDIGPNNARRNFLSEIAVPNIIDN